MKVVMLAGGVGSRLTEETEVRPKSRVEIAGYPMLWHIMRHYEKHGFREFVIALGDKGEDIKKYFVDYCALNGDLPIDFETGGVAGSGLKTPSRKISLIETGITTQMGGRIKRLASYSGNETFLLTWSNGYYDVNC